MNSALCTALEKTVVERFKSLEKEMKNQVNATTAVVTTMADLSGTMTEQFKFVANSAQNMGKSATALAKSVDEFKPAVTGTLETIREQFVKSITDGSKVMENAGKSIKTAVVEMSNKAKEGQDKLDATLSDFNKRINTTLSDIKQTTLAMETQGNKNVQTIKEVNAKIEENLVSISTVNMQIRTAMKKLPKDLSDSINETLLDVKKSIETSVSKSADKVVKTLETASSAAAKPLPAKEKVVHSKEISA
jgi:gas vesicle protein